MFILIFILIASLGCEVPLKPEDARQALENRDIAYSQREYFAAAAAGDLKTVKLFIESGMEVDAQSVDYRFETALMYAAGNGRLGTVKYLIGQGANPMLKGSACASALAGWVIENSATDCQRQTAIMWAAYGGHLKVVKYLEGKLPFIEDYTWLHFPNGPNSGIMLAAYAGYLDMVKFLFDVVYHPKKASLGAIGWAAYGGHLDIVRWLFKHKNVPINPRGTMSGRGNGITPLMLAGYNGHIDVVKFLLNNGADIHVRTSRTWMDREGSTFREYGASALTLAAENGQDEVMALILNHWVYQYGVEGRDDHGRTALMYAALWGNVEWINRLIDTGAIVNTTTYTGSTTLMFAVASGKKEIVELFLALGEDPAVVNSNGYTALRIAEELGYEDIANLLRDA